jgi:hypothetical protein
LFLGVYACEGDDLHHQTFITSRASIIPFPQLGKDDILVSTWLAGFKHPYFPVTLLTQGFDTCHKFSSHMEGIMGFYVVERSMTTQHHITFDDL